MDKFIFVRCEEKLNRIKSHRYADYFVSTNLCQNKFLKRCEHYRKQAIIFDENINANKLNLKELWKGLDKYKDSTSFGGNVLGFDLTYKNLEKTTVIKSILAALDNKKMTYSRYLNKNAFAEFPSHIAVATKARQQNYNFSSLMQIDLHKKHFVGDIFLGLRLNVCGFEFVGDTSRFYLKKVVSFLKKIEKRYFECRGYKSFEYCIKGDVEYFTRDGYIFIYNRNKKQNISVELPNHSKINMQIMNTNYCSESNIISFSLKENECAFISFV